MANNEEAHEERPPQIVNDGLIRKVAKTMLYRKPLKSQDPPEIQGNSPAEPLKKPKTKVAKTQLDHKLIVDVHSRFGEKQNRRLEEEISKRQIEPAKPIEPIKAHRKVSSCPFSWTEESAKERFKYCPNCQRTIYQFDGMELDQAEALIFKRENRDEFVLYQRADGKFMTSDCPIAQRKRIQLIGLVAACVCVVTLLVASIMMTPPSPPPAAESAKEGTAPEAATSDADSSRSVSASAKEGGRTHHYEAGDPIPAVPSSDASKNKSPKSFSEQEQRGDFWQFPNGQPADDFRPAPGASSGN